VSSTSPAVAGSGLSAGLGPRTPACGQSQRQARSQPGPDDGGLYTEVFQSVLTFSQRPRNGSVSENAGVEAKLDGNPR
jgi:hypothetical protein